MRHVFTVALFAALFSFGCASKNKTSDNAPAAPATTPASPTASTPAKTDGKSGAAAATADKPSAAEGSKIECANKADKRTLEVRAKDKGCELAYTKNGQEAVVASGRSGDAHCKASQEKITEKLRGAGFTCN